MNLSGQKREDTSGKARPAEEGEAKPSPCGLSLPGQGQACLSSLPHPYINPHAGDLLVHHVRLDVAGHGSGEGLPLLLILGDGDEQGWGQEDELELLLGPIQEHGPGAERAKEKPEASGASSRKLVTKAPFCQLHRYLTK